MNRIQNRYRFRQVAAALALLCLGLALPDSGRAQAVERTLRLDQPALGVSHRLEGLRDVENPRVLVVHSAHSASRVRSAESVVRDAVYYWEILLLGLDVPYEVITDKDLARGIDRDTRLLILPAAEVLSGKQRNAILKYVKRGGAVIASGRTGFYDDRGRESGSAFFNDFTGAQHVTSIPDQPFGLLHTVDGRTPAAYGIPMGYRLNVSAMQPLSAARPIDARALGRPISYSGRDDALLGDLTLLLFNRIGDGKVFWSRFNPQDVSREQEQQKVYQRMVVNAMAYLTSARTVAVRPWPNASGSALSVVTLPTVGFDPLSYLGGYSDVLDLMQSQGVRGTFFLTAREAAAFPDLNTRMAALGEIGTASDTDDVLLGMPLDAQRERIQSGRGAFSMQAAGLYPPGGFFDGNTLRASANTGIKYLLLPQGSSLSPGSASWWDDVDYRSLRETSQRNDLALLRARTAAAVAARANATPTRRRRRSDPDPEVASTRPAAPLPVVTMPLDPGVTDFLTRYASIHRAGGLYVLPYYPESQRTGSNRASQLELTAATARQNGSWNATLSEVATWWAAKERITVAMVDMAEDIMVFDVVNPNREAMRGLTLELRLHDDRFTALYADGVDAELLRGDEDGSLLLVIANLPSGTTRFSIERD